jgi:hypothetical protein
MNSVALDRLHSVAEICAPPPALGETLVASLEQAIDARFPFRHLQLEHLLPAPITAALRALPLTPPSTLPVWGEPPAAVGRRHRLRPSGPAAAPVSRALARAFAKEAVTRLIAQRAEVDVADCRIRLTVTQEVDGYACEPCTAQGEARFRLVIGLSSLHQSDLGPDLYLGPETWAAQLPWGPGAAFAFAPAADTWHGFEPRLIRRLRTCLVVDYLAAG